MMDLHPLFWIAPLGAGTALITAYVFFRLITAANPGNARMIEISGYVKEGAMAYLRRQYGVVIWVFAALFAILVGLAFFGMQSPLVPIGFLTGGFLSGLSGYLGMLTATAASNRTAQAASESLDRGLKIAFRSGAVMGLVVVGFVLFDISAWFLFLRYLASTAAPGESVFFLGLNLGPIGPAEQTSIMLNFAMGASLQALFARVGGGIFTKAADVGADLVGKVEAGIPEDDPRNPATIADNVGDNVGDVAGMGADLYESFAGSIFAAAALGAAAFTAAGSELQLQAAIAPLMVAGAGTIASAIGCFFIRTREGASQKDLMAALHRGVWIASGLVLVASFFIVRELLPGNPGVFWAIISGLAAGLVIAKTTEYYTSADYAPTQWLAAQTQTGPATTIIGGLAIGMQSTLIPVLAIVGGTIAAFLFAGGAGSVELGLFGIGIAAVGMLSTLGITLATDAYGPIADNAGGNAQMAQLPGEVRERTDALDSLGNTTAATGKGFAIGSAAMTALALIAAYIEQIRSEIIRATQGTGAAILVGAGDAARHLTETEIRSLGISEFANLYQIGLLNPTVLMGLFIGAMMAFYFCSLTMKAVGRSAAAIVTEVRRQFKEIPGLLEGKPGVQADYARCVTLCTGAAQKEMILPSLLAIIVPVLVGILFNVAGVVGLLAGALSTGFALAVMMANSGGAWDNAKKFIEQGNYGGKGSDAHKAGVVGDTVGDPFKDTSGPSLNILIKLMAMVSIVFSGLIVSCPPVINYIPRLFRFFGF